ncbi:thiamine phosphate synthase [Lactococcus nasutitermitis]|uniref:Thiamine-phosphate synthase n=1 Tax=Lactococcus nasutitermitis TaxID=1652957 RepID=A0ABV9JGE1_9LACT|nr:thiamine phosphate synthase [Lactococcus nasutitermitis]
MNKNFLKCYFIAGPQDFPNLSLEEAEVKISKLIASGVTAYQFRDKGTHYKNEDGRLGLANRLRKVAKAHNVPFIINDDSALAFEVGADGLHLGQDDMAVSRARDLLGKKVFIGLSVRNEQELIQAQSSKADYLGIGPIYQTSSKKDAAKPIGDKLLTSILQVNQLPIVGIGGIDLSKAEKLAKTGLDGVAIISLLTETKMPYRTINTILRAFE